VAVFLPLGYPSPFGPVMGHHGVWMIAMGEEDKFEKIMLVQGHFSSSNNFLGIFI
jgi:hypothetical protein